MDEEDKKTCVIAAGHTVLLRDALPSDEERRAKWRTEGEWRQYDAPWELSSNRRMSEEEKRRRFEEVKAKAEAFAKRYPSLRRGATIATTESKPLGWVNLYDCDDEHFPQSWSVGISICEDDYLNRGLGTEALGLWIDYLFSKSDVHRIGLTTYSFNKRMMRVAEKVGLKLEGRRREVREWQGEWIDLLTYGILRREWEE